MECPKCESSQVVRLPPSQISPHPGYRCTDCGLKMRESGMLFVYIIVLVIGLAVGGLFVSMAIARENDNFPYRGLWLAGAGLVVAGYSAMQIARPAPLSKPKLDKEE